MPAGTRDKVERERAVRAANEMQAVLSEMNRGFAAEGKPELAMRIAELKWLLAQIAEDREPPAWPA